MRARLWPDVAVQPRLTDPAARMYVRSYVFMRLVTGLLGFALPPVLILLEPALFNGQPFLRGSLSAYYYSGMREIFVGVLCAIGVFLITYKLLERSRESVLSTLSGFAAILVAVFPTQRPGDEVGLIPFQVLLGETTVKLIHYGAAGIFILSLAGISYYFGKYGRTRRRFHYTCAVVIGVAFVLAVVAAITSQPDKGLLIAEVVAVWAFGLSWLVKGAEIDILLGRTSRRASAAAA